jgi:hypothetical protein
MEGKLKIGIFEERYFIPLKLLKTILSALL